MKVLKIIYNPNAGQKSKKLFFNVLTELEVNSVRYDLEATEYAGHGVKIARRLSLDENVNIIIAAGGDGTINEVLNGIIGSDKKLGIIPLGTANVLAKEIGLKNDPIHIAETLQKQKKAMIFPAKVNGHYFSLMASIGYDAHAVQNVNLKWKNQLGEAAYFFAFIKELLKGKPPKYSVEIDGKNHDCYGAIITNGKYYAGKYICAPDASLFDNNLKAILFKDKGAWAAIKYFIAIGFNRLHKCKAVEYCDVTKVQVSANKTAPIQIDGDTFGDLPVMIKTSETPIQLLVP